MGENHWEHFAHSADIGIRGVGATLGEAFEQAALALTAVVTDIETVSPNKEIRIECDSPNEELLFADWINELVYQMSVRRMLFSRFEVMITDAHLAGKAWGEPVDVGKHEPTVEVKGATFTELKVSRDEDGNRLAQCVVDV